MVRMEKPVKLQSTTLLLWKPWIVLLCMAPAILFYLVLSVIPSLTTAVLSFTDISGIPGMAWKWVGIENYHEFFFLQNYRDTFDALKRTFIFSISVTTIQNVLALLVAVLLNSKLLKWRDVARSVVFLPTILGITIVCFAWSFFFTLDGPADTFVKAFGMTSMGFLGSTAQAFPIVIFVQIWYSLGYAMMIYIAGLQSIPGDLYEAGSIDGTSPSQAFFKITIPLLWPTITVNVMLSLIGSLSVVQTILLLTAGGNNTSTLAMRIFSQAFGIGSAAPSNSGTMRQGFAAAQSMVLFGIILCVTILAQYFMRKNERDV